MIEQIQRVLSPDLLKPQFRKQGEHPLYGHCYAASEALYHLLGGKNKGYKAVRGKDNQGITHWWIVDKNGRILDPTSEQYTSKRLQPPYANGRPAGFLTREPSKRAAEIIRRINNIQ